MDLARLIPGGIGTRKAKARALAISTFRDVGFCPLLGPDTETVFLEDRVKVLKDSFLCLLATVRVELGGEVELGAAACQEGNISAGVDFSRMG
jgi:hypothetical protein